MSVELKALSALVKRLENAKCWRDESNYGWRSTRWWHLIPSDVDLALEVLRREMWKRETREKTAGDN